MKNNNIMRSATSQNIGREKGRVVIHYKDGTSIVTPVIDQKSAHIIANILWNICKNCGTLEV